MPQLPDSLAKIVQRFAHQTNNKLRYEQLLWYAKKLPEFPSEAKLPENQVPGCVSQVYITCQLQGEKVYFQGDSDSQLVKGLLGLLITGLNGLTIGEILEVSPEFIKDTGLNVSLTPSRANGFYNIFQAMRKQALLYQNSNSKQ
ncbi:cysteine desufuration protein SufE [[Phormidium ambiguum] IAM M-71]|uniref:Cysteine desufuration protein SufE n=1 Tax=[Phormidium ambiguum] IAM M-71 TaxID=454136 RepID=A0A1U7IN70_9CYAN|nr:SufE family protein [Phormidium ambiguum]OKH38794.1 cysteine desufuration protein SufE [Phormidium ambiguum IAM M-71]